MGAWLLGQVDNFKNNAKSVQFSFTRASADLVNYAVVLGLCLPKDDVYSLY